MVKINRQNSVENPYPGVLHRTCKEQEKEANVTRVARARPETTLFLASEKNYFYLAAGLCVIPARRLLSIHPAVNELEPCRAPQGTITEEED